MFRVGKLQIFIPIDEAHNNNPPLSVENHKYFCCISADVVQSGVTTRVFIDTMN